MCARHKQEAIACAYLCINRSYMLRSTMLCDGAFLIAMVIIIAEKCIRIRCGLIIAGAASQERVVQFMYNAS